MINNLKCFQLGPLDPISEQNSYSKRHRGGLLGCSLMFSPKTSDSPERLEETPNGDENPHNLLRNTQYKRSDTRVGFEVNIIPFHVVFVPRVLGKQLADAVLTVEGWMDVLQIRGALIFRPEAP